MSPTMFSQASYEEVCGQLVGTGLSWASGWWTAATVVEGMPTKAALIKPADGWPAPTRCGQLSASAGTVGAVRIVEGLLDQQLSWCSPGSLRARLAEPRQTRGAWYRGWRLMSIDGTCIDVADTPANEAEFGRPGTGRGEGAGAFPQARLIGLAECGTHATGGPAGGPQGAVKHRSSPRSPRRAHGVHQRADA